MMVITIDLELVTNNNATKLNNKEIVNNNKLD